MSSYDDVNQAFQKKLQEDPEFRKKFGEGISFSLEKAGLIDAPIKIELERGKVVETSALEAKKVITAEVFYWGYHFVIPEAAMKDFNSAGNVVTAFMSLGGSVIAASGGALAPLVAIVAAYAAAELVLMNAIDKGKGAYLSAVWVAPGLIIPTPIK